MTEEVKQVRTDWYEKSSSFLGGNFIFDIYNVLQDIDSALVECNEILGEVGLWTGYVTKQMKIAEIMEERCTLHGYIQCLPEYVRTMLDQPFLSFVSSVLDITIIKPIIESAMGEDMITGEDLSDFECDMKVVFAIIDLVTLGQAIAATKLIELGGKEALEVLGKTLLIEFTSNAAATGMAGIGEALDLPTSITILLSLGTGLGVSLEGNKLLFKNAAGDLLREVQLKDDQMRSIEEVMDDADGWSFNGGLLNGVDDDLILYRRGYPTEGIGEYGYGKWWSDEKLSIEEAREQLAILENWGNPLTGEYEMIVPKGTKVITGIADEQAFYDDITGELLEYRGGGAKQYWFNEIDKAWIK